MPSPQEKLANLEKAGLLKSEATSKKEIEGFLAAAKSRLADSKNAQISFAGRFSLAYDAAYALALLALRANGFRPAEGKGHRFIVFQCLAHTVGVPSAIWASLSKAHEKRNASVYSGLVEASVAETEDLIATTDKLFELATDWLKKNRPDLLG